MLFARCLLVFAPCSLDFARYSLVFPRCSLLFARCSLPFASFSLLLTFCSFLFTKQNTVVVVFFLCSVLFKTGVYSWKHKSVEFETFGSYFFVTVNIYTRYFTLRNCPYQQSVKVVYWNKSIKGILGRNIEHFQKKSI